MSLSRPVPGGGAPFGIDLEAGVATIIIKSPQPADPEEPVGEPAGPGEDDQDTDDRPSDPPQS